MAKFNLGFCGAVALLGAVCLPIAADDAATVTETYDFNITFPSGAPFTTWDGSFTITFNPTGGAVGPSALDAFSSNLPASYGTFSFIYNGAGGNGLGIGDNCIPGECFIDPGMDTAGMAFFPVTASGGLTFEEAIIASTSDSNTAFESTGGSLTPASPATPLPATLPLFATGLGALGLLGWFRKRKARVSLLGAA
jgi:hypothetical protein